MEWKRGFTKGCPFGRDDTSPKKGELLQFEVLYLACPFILCFCFAFQGLLY